MRKHDCALPAQYTKHSNARGHSLGLVRVRVRVRVRFRVRLRVRPTFGVRVTSFGFYLRHKTIFAHGDVVV